MARRKISLKFKHKLSEKLMDLGNLVAAALVLGQFVSGHDFSVTMALLGTAGAILCYVASYIITL